MVRKEPKCGYVSLFRERGRTVVVDRSVGKEAVVDGWYMTSEAMNELLIAVAVDMESGCSLGSELFNCPIT